MKEVRDDRKRQVATTRDRHGRDFYRRIGSLSSGKGQTFRDPEKARAAANKRWHPEQFGTENSST